MQDQKLNEGQLTKAKVIILASRLPFLILVPVCILLVITSIQFYFDVFKPFFTFLILFGALSAHASVNLFNEYLDFKSGLDFKTMRTPFSGGSGAIPAQPSSSKYVLAAAVATLTMTIFSGLYLLKLSMHAFEGFNTSLLLIGLLGVMLVLLYTGPMNRNPWLCFISPGLGFGFMMTYGASSAILGRLPVELLPVALLLFFMVNNLLLLNQLPDVDADSSIGRKHIWITKGHIFGTRLYLFTTLLVLPLFSICILRNIWPVISLLSLLPWCLTLFAWYGAKKLGSGIVNQPKFLAMNVIATLGVPLVLSIVLFVSA